MKFYFEYLKNLNRLNRRASSNAGFSLTEILIAGMMMLFVLMIAGIGMINFLRNNYKTNAASEIQTNINRALEFVSDEIRRAKTIAENEDEIVSTEDLDGGTAVLAFQIPNPANPSQPFDEQIVYYTKPSEEDLGQIGPRVLWRYGPNFDENGNYTTPTDTTTWVHSPLVDMLVETAAVSDRDCDPYDDDETLNEANWIRIPEDDVKVKGFFACVRDGGNLVLLRASSEASLNSYTVGGQQDKVEYTTDTKISTRSGGGPGFCIGCEDVPTRGTATTTPRVTLTDNSTVTGRILEKCVSVCTISVQDDDAPKQDDRLTVDINSTVTGKAGDEIRVYAGGVNSAEGDVVDPIDPTLIIQTVDLYFAGDALPSGINITLKENQVLYVLYDGIDDLRYNIIVTINPL